MTSICGQRSYTIISILLISSQENLLITNSRRIKLIAASFIASHLQKPVTMPLSHISNGHHPSRSAPSMAQSLDYCRLPSHLGKSSELVCTRFDVSYLDILDFCFLEYHNVIHSVLSGDWLLSFILIKVLRGKFCFVSRIKQDQLFYEFMRFIRLAKSYLQFSRSL